MTNGKALGLEPEAALRAIAALAAASLPEAPAAFQAPHTQLPPEGIDLEAHLEAVREALMREALDRCGGVQTNAVELLGISFRSFRYYARRLGLKPAEERPGSAAESARSESP